MSGGSMDYLYILVRDAAFHTHSPERKAFREHLTLVASALRSIEWNDSGDGDDQEVHNIMACISPSASENDKLRAEIGRLRAERRERIATAAMQAMLTCAGRASPNDWSHVLAMQAVEYADALIAELDKEPQP